MSKRQDDSSEPKLGEDPAESGGAESASEPSSPAMEAIVGAIAGNTAEPAAATDGELSAQGRDVVFAYRKTDEGDGFQVIRSRDNRLEIGEVRELCDGKPIRGDIVKLSPIAGRDRLFDVEVVMEASRIRATTGPPQVSTEAYRQQWEAIFGQRPSTGPRELN